jgi:glycogen phosphorylase
MAMTTLPPPSRNPYKPNPKQKHLPLHLRQTECPPAQVEDDRTGMTPETLKRAFLDNLFYLQGKDEAFATLYDYYMALAYTVRDRLIHRWMKTEQAYFREDVKVVFYLSLEYLMGRQLANNLVNVGLWERAHQALQELGLELYDLVEQEVEPGLGNGGLGRLAACFLDSLATLQIPAIGYGIRYEFGVFNQEILDGWQVERPDQWLRHINPWEIARPEYMVEVNLGGRTVPYIDEQGGYRVKWIADRTILGTPYDTFVPGYNTNTVNTLRLWSAKASQEFDFQVFNAGDYTRAVSEKTFSENISKVLYPNDNTPQGKELRLEQQYFFVACTLQDILRLYFFSHDNFDHFISQVAIQLNDTHPSLGIAELMRLLVDEYLLDWEPAWQLTQKVFSYTNHTLMLEALEQWPVELFARLLPRHLEIVYEINRRFLEEIRLKFPNEPGRETRMSLIAEGTERQVRMAHLACIGSHAINGVSELHSQLLQKNLFQDFYALYPERFSNKTNGVTPRRWLLLSNPKLTLLITQQIGQGWITELNQLRQLEPCTDDPNFRQAWRRIKRENKHDLATYIAFYHGMEINPDSLFSVQVKRIHEYKRQLLNVLHILTLYNRIKQGQVAPESLVPQTFIFGGKAAPGYFMAKLIIKFIHAVANVINFDPIVSNCLKVIFLTNYGVSLAQRICAAADLSVQISLAGKEASGTSNMKFAMNGALTVGTYDGANIEIRHEVGAENFFLFGLKTEAIAQLRTEGYNPWVYYSNQPELRNVIDQIASGYFSPQEPDLFRPIVQSLLIRDDYLTLADYGDYLFAQEQVMQAYRNPEDWTKMSILNTARMGKFSSDRTIWEYTRDIWDTPPVPIQIEAL